MAAKSLVTGGAGYFGHLLVGKLVKNGEEVRIFDLNPADDRPGTVEFFQGDIRDRAAIAKAAAGMDVIYHNVAQVPLAKDRDLFRSVNRDGTRNMLEAAQAAGVKKVVFTSSSAVFGIPASNPVTVEMEPNPMEEYGAAKFEGEKICREFSAAGLDVSIIRPRTILGHGRLGIFQVLFEWIRQGYNVPVLGKGDNVYQFVHADDLAEACILAARRKGSETYNCGTDRYGTMHEVLSDLCQYAGTGAKVRRVPMLPAELGMKFTSAVGISPLGAYHALMYGRSMYFDISKAESELGWKPKYSNTEMFRESYDWYVEHRQEVLASRGMSLHRGPVKEGVLSLVKRLL